MRLSVAYWLIYKPIRFCLKVFEVAIQDAQVDVREAK